ncbi:MAG: CBS domain-containing protein [Kofleriaceae bacterium]
MLMPSVSRYMTLNPCTISPQDTVATAFALMRSHGFRHLPVTKNGKLVGIISDRDLRIDRTRGATDLEAIRAEDVMTKTVIAVAPETPMDQALQLMSAMRCSSLVAIDKTGVAGILTASDALWALSDLLRREAS